MEEDVYFLRSFDDEKLDNMFEEHVMMKNFSNPLRIPVGEIKKPTPTSSFKKQRSIIQNNVLESISEQDELDPQGNDSRSEHGIKERANSGELEMFSMKKVKNEIKKSMNSSSLNALLDNDQVKTLYNIKIRKAKGVLSKKHIGKKSSVGAASQLKRKESNVGKQTDTSQNNFDYEDYMKEIDLEHQFELQDIFDEEKIQYELPKN